MGRSGLKPRAGPSIRDFLRYYVLALLRWRGRTLDRMIETIEKDSAGNRDYRPSGQVVVDRDEFNKVLAHLRRGKLIKVAGNRWRITTEGRQRLSLYEDKKEKESKGKDKAARKVLKLMGEPGPAESVLDVGTGEGFLAFKLADKGYRVLGIDSGNFDYSKDSIQSAVEKAASRGGEVEFSETSVADLAATGESFDYVVTSQAIHCMKDQRQCLDAIYRLLKPGGTFLCMDFLVGLEGFLHHGWHSFLAISREEWRRLLPQFGFDEVGCHKAGDYLVVRARKRLGGERES